MNNHHPLKQRSALALGIMSLCVFGLAAQAQKNQNFGVFTGYTNGNVSMIFYGTPGWQYVIQRATNLVQSGTIWVSIATNIFPGSGSITFTDTFSNITPPPPPYPRAAYYRFQSQTNGPLANFWNGVEGAWYADAGNLGEQGEDGFGLGGFIFPSMLVNAATSEIWAYYIFHYNGTNFLTGDAEIKSTVGRARSADTDGVSWVCDGMVMDVGAAGQWDDQYASFPGIWKDSNTWYLVYEGAGDGDSANSSPGDIGLATSTDGLNFVKYPGNPILRHNATGWENNNIGTPSLYKANGTWYLFYHGFDGTYCRDGVATGTSLTNLVKYAGNPIIDVASNTSAWDSGTIGRRSAIAQEGGYYYLAYEGSTPQPYSTAQWSSGLARSTDLFHWTKFSGNPVLPRTTSGFGYDGPEMIQINGTWYIYVRVNGSEEPEMRFRLQ